MLLVRLQKKKTWESLDCKTVVFFLKISKEIGKACRKSLTRAKRASLLLASLPRSRSLFSASFQTFCLTARAYMNTQKYGLFCSLENLLFFRTVRRQLFTHTLLHHSSTTPYSLFTFLIHSARQFACEQALLLVDSREVTREPHAKGDVSARVESSLAGYTTVRYFLFTRPI